MPPIIYIFSLCAFAFGFSEFIPIGLSSIMAVYFKVNISQIGLAVTTYAAGVVIGTPILTALAAKSSVKSHHVRLDSASFPAKFS